MSDARPDIGAEAVLNFWFNESKPRQWFRRSDAFDAVVRHRFGALAEQACAGERPGLGAGARSIQPPDLARSGPGLQR